MLAISTGACTTLGGVDKNRLIKLGYCDLQSLKQIAVTVFVSLFSMFESRLQISVAMQTVGCRYCDTNCGKRHQSDSKFTSCEMSAMADSLICDI